MRERLNSCYHRFRYREPARKFTLRPRPRLSHLLLGLGPETEKQKSMATRTTLWRLTSPVFGSSALLDLSYPIFVLYLPFPTHLKVYYSTLGDKSARRNNSERALRAATLTFFEQSTCAV